MELRRATAEDWQASREVRLSALTQNPDAFCATLESESAFDEQGWRDRLGRAHTILAWNGATPVGTVTGKLDPREEGGREIVAMWVNPGSRGTGLSDALIAAIIDWSRTEGAHEVALWVAEDNGHARALYERCGFSGTGERDVMRPGVDQIRMRLALAP